VLEACRLVAERAGTTLQALLPTVSRFGLGTTAVTNTIASRTGRRAGLVTTSGFEDLVPIARAMRVPSDGWLVSPVPLIDREWIVGVRERIDRNGEVLTKLDMAAVRTRGRRLVAEHGVEALVVGLRERQPRTGSRGRVAAGLSQPDCHVGGGTANGHQGVRAHPVRAA
jgi:N-methylhydantoinase A